MKTINIIILTFTCFISTQLLGQTYTTDQLIGTWDFLTIGGQNAPTGAQLILEANKTGKVNVGGGFENITYELNNGVLYLNTNAIGNVEMKILSCQSNLLKMEDKKDGTVVELKKKAPTFTDPRDGEVYEIVVIGSQTWMAENLRFEMPGSWSNPDNPNPKYGRLYEWSSALKACPAGWHLPDFDDWARLESTFGLSLQDIMIENQYRGQHGTALKAKTAWSQNNNSSGFSAILAGLYDNGDYDYLDINAGFWLNSEKDARTSYFIGFGAGEAGVKFSDEDKSLGLSCRCVKY